MGEQLIDKLILHKGQISREWSEEKNMRNESRAGGGGDGTGK